MSTNHMIRAMYHPLYHHIIPSYRQFIAPYHDHRTSHRTIAPSHRTTAPSIVPSHRTIAPLHPTLVCTQHPSNIPKRIYTYLKLRKSIYIYIKLLHEKLLGKGLFASKKNRLGAEKGGLVRQPRSESVKRENVHPTHEVLIGKTNSVILFIPQNSLGPPSR